MQPKEDIFIENELRANTYCARCMLIGAFIAIAMWVLNLMHFFIVDDAVMNIAMPIGIAFFVTPFILLKFVRSYKRWVKSVILFSFLIGITVLATGLTTQLVLAWACPILISCHFYSPRFTTMALVGVIFFMLIATYLGLYFGVWDANMMRCSESVTGLAERIAFIEQAKANGDNIITRVLYFYYLPRAGIIAILFIIARTLSKRTHDLLETHQTDFYHRQKMSSELAIATQIQYAAMPTTFPAFPDHDEFEVYASMTPSKEVGGDFYDFFLIDPDHIALVMADVSGKGVPAAMFMMSAKTLIKNNVRPDSKPSEVLRKVNDKLCENANSDLFVTVWFAIYEISTGIITASNAGHEYPIVKLGDKPFEIHKAPVRNGFVLAGMENSKYNDYTIQLGIGDTLFLYTDGIVEAIDPHNVPYGIPRFLLHLNRNDDRGLEELLKSVKNDVDLFAAGAPQFDDMTMLALRRYK